MKRVDTINRKKIDIVSVALALVAVVLIGGWLIISPDKAVENITNVKAGVTHVLSPFHLWLGLGCFVYLLDLLAFQIWKYTIRERKTGVQNIQLVGHDVLCGNGIEYDVMVCC